MSLESKYLEQFKRLSESPACPGLYGDRLLIEVLKKEELKTESGLILETNAEYHSETESNRETMGVVLMVGEGAYDPDAGVEVELDYKVGNVVLVSPYALTFYTKFPGLVGSFELNTVALVRHTGVHMRWESFLHYEEYKKVLNQSA